MFSYLNIRGLIPQTVPTKVPYITDELAESSAVAFSLTETWLTESHTEAELKINGYTIKRKDRNRRKTKRGRSSGGVAIYIRDDMALDAEEVFSFSNGVIESLGVYIPALNLVKIVTYRSPDQADITENGEVIKKRYRSTSIEFKSYIVQLKKFLQSLPAPTPDIIMMGDYNLPHANWLTGECTRGASTEEQQMVKALYEIALENFLIQQIDCPTHKDGNTIDLLFTNNSSIIHNAECLPSAVSDHLLMNFSTVYKKSQATDEETEDPRDNENAHDFSCLNFFDANIDWDSLSYKLKNYDWSREFRGSSTSVMMERFTTSCLHICRDHVPTRKNRSASQKQRIPKQRRSLIRRRSHLRKRYSNARSATARTSLSEKLVSIEKKLLESHKQKKALSETRAVSNIKTNPKYFYAYAKRLSKVKVGIGPLIDASKKLINAPRKIAEILSEQYCSVFSSPIHEDVTPDLLFPKYDVINHHSLTDVIFSAAELAEAMHELDPTSAPGPDSFPAILLHKCSDSLSSPLAKIWRSSLKTGEIPSVCKAATITPIHKGKSRAVPKNYRPVALTSHLIKVFEKVIRKRIVQFMEKHELFNKSQHGFRGGRSCLSQLLAHFDHITACLEKGCGVDVVYLDFAKAFDKLDHGITLYKLKSLGIHGNLATWITNFLTNRTQSVIVDGRKSLPRPVISGVPQGSVLGPLMFLVLIGDIDENVVSSFLSSFADDTRVGREISSATDPLTLQADLAAIYAWSALNNMEFNCDKFELVRYKTNLSRDVQAETSYTGADGTVIEEKDNVRDLGVTLSNDASFNTHIHERCEMVKSKIAWVLRTFSTRHRLPMLTLWKSLILNHIEYCSQLWSPSKVGSTQSLELLQKSFISRIDGMQGLSYWEQLQDLKMYSLERRRERYQAIYTWRMLEGQVPNIDTTPFRASLSDRRGRMCVIPPILPSAPERIKTIRFASLTHKGPRLFNSLPSEVRNLTGCCTETFKNALDRYLRSLPDQPLIPNYTQYRQCESNSIIDWGRHLQYQRRNSMALTHGQLYEDNRQPY